MTPHSWLDDEVSASETVRQAVRLVVAGCRRPLVLLAVTLGFATTVAGAVLVAKHSYAPRYVLRIVEPDRDPSGMPRPRRELAAYVREAVFTSKPLLAIIERHDLYPGLARRNPRAALNSFREDIDVDVYGNYFVEERSAGAGPRSARPPGARPASMPPPDPARSTHPSLQLRVVWSRRQRRWGPQSPAPAARRPR